ERLSLRDAGLQAAEYVHPAAAAIVHVVPVRRHLRLQHDRDAHACDGSDIETVESWLRDADDGERIVVDRETAAGDGGVAAEAIAPVVVAEDRHEPVGARPVIVWPDDAAERGADAEHLE